jgi:hypothetical protein
MGFNAAATIIPGKGTVLVADPDTLPPTDYLTLDPSNPTSFATAAPGWDAMGHTSRENNVALSKEGGEATSAGSWWDAALETNYSDVTWGITVNSIQIDALTLGLAFGGGTLDAAEGFYDVASSITPQAKALFVLMVSGNKRMAFYIPNTTVTIGDAPEIATDAFFEIQLSATMKSSETTGKRFRIYHPALKAVTP